MREEEKVEKRRGRAHLKILVLVVEMEWDGNRFWIEDDGEGKRRNTADAAAMCTATA